MSKNENYMDLKYSTLIEFLRSVLKFDGESKIAIYEQFDEFAPLYIGKIINLPIIYSDRKIFKLECMDEKIPKIYLKKYEKDANNDQIWNDWN